MKIESWKMCALGLGLYVERVPTDVRAGTQHLGGQLKLGISVCVATAGSVEGVGGGVNRSDERQFGRT
jgi:hypothetical protein